jgi:tetratricopeptide (TPR) repeat protein
MQIALRTPAGKLCLKLICLLVTTAYMVIAAREYVAFRLGTSAERHAMEEAIALEASNAEYRHDLGSYFIASEQRPDLAIPNYRAAVTLNPYLADYWLDLARAYESTGDGREEERALKQALEVDPNTPTVLWEVANGFLRRDDFQKAFRVFRLLLQTDKSRIEPTVQICWYATHNVDTMMSDVLPPTPNVYLAFLKLLVGERETEAAARIWAQLIGMQQYFDPQLASAYVEYQIAQHDIDHAQAAWNDLGRIDAGFRPYLVSAGNLVVNGSFEQRLLNMGFDWRFADHSSVTLAPDAQQFHSGNRSLSVTFNGQAAVDAGLQEFMAIDPNTRYKFSVFVRTDEIFAAQGPQFAISDAYSNNPLLLSEELLGTTNWRQIRGSFATGPETRLVVLRIMRASGAGPITGKLWIDDVSVVKE